MSEGHAARPDALAPAPLERVCLHEYAHLVVARTLGAYGFVRIVRCDGPDATPRYAGAFQMHGTLDERAWRLVALAGTLAEWLADAPGLAADDACARLEAPDALSHADACLAAGHGQDDVRDCLGLLRERWAVIASEAGERATSLRDAGASATKRRGAG